MSAGVQHRTRPTISILRIFLIPGVVAALSGTARAEHAPCDEASRMNLERILPSGLLMFEMAQILTEVDADDENNDICRVPIMTSGGPGVLRF